MNLKVICNTGPIIAFSMIDGLHILQSLFETVTIPETVHLEILEGGTLRIGLESYRKADWIKVEKIKGMVDPLLTTTLDKGEAEVIGLSFQTGVHQVLIDERKARKIARTIYGLHVIGSTRVLLEAKKHKIIDNISDPLRKMREGGYFIGDSIVAAALTQAGETSFL